jgi:hypothetical protein
MKLVKEHINEKFTEEFDPIDDLGIGLSHIMKNIVEKIFDIDLKNIGQSNCVFFSKNFRYHEWM